MLKYYISITSHDIHNSIIQTYKWQIFDEDHKSKNTYWTCIEFSNKNL